MAKGRTAHGDAIRAGVLREILARPERPPTYQELADALHIGKYSAQQHVAKLVADGILSRAPRSSRGILVRDGERARSLAAQP